MSRRAASAWVADAAGSATGPGSRLAAALAALLAAPGLWAQTVVPEQSEIAFVSRQMGVPIEGRFKTWSAELEFDPRRPETGRLTLTIATGSASFAAAQAEAEVGKPAWFDTARFAQARFESTSIRSVGPGRFDIAGRLTLKGTTQALTVPVTLSQSGPAGSASGSFVLKRLDYRIGEGEWADTSLVANEVQVRFRIVLAGLPPP